MYSLDDTIAAVASPPGGAARGIVRISGPGLRDCLEGLFRPDPPLPLPTVTRPTVVPGLFWLPRQTSPLACDLYLWPGRRSYTGQPVAEVHTLGSPPLLAAVLRAICAAGARPAEPGEFTLRAFLAGRIDLTQAEAVLGVIDAADPEELKVALAQLAGGLAGPLQQLRSGLLDLLAHLEAGFDFADEDLAFIAPEELAAQLDQAMERVARLAKQTASRSETADLVRVALVGRPNAGKSSLFNALACGAALVSAEPGTTRDYLTAELDLDGVKCQLIDTAGMERGTGEGADRNDRHRAPPSIERAAEAASAAQYRQAHVRVWCLDSTQLLDQSELEAAFCDHRQRQVVVLTKNDLKVGLPELGGAAADGKIAPNRQEEPVLKQCSTDSSSPCRGQQSTELPPYVGKLGIGSHPRDAIRTSTVTGAGLDVLRDCLREVVLTVGGARGDVVVGTAQRCRESLRLALQCLERARRIGDSGGGEELVAAEVRETLDELGKVAGAVYTEDVLERIFSRFCVGK